MSGPARAESSLWRNRDFLKLWTGQTVSEVGSRVSREGIPLTAALVLNAQPSEMGILAGLGAISVLAFGLVAGVWVDRVRRRPILIAADLGRAAILGTVPLAAFWHVLTMAQLYVVVALTGVLTVFFDVAYQSYLPSLVAPDRIADGNAKLMLSATSAEVLGPSLTGMLVQWITAPLAILLDALSFVFSAVMVGLMGPHAEAPRGDGPAETRVLQESLAGLRFIARQPALRALAMRSIMAHFFGGLYMTVYILYALRDLGLNTTALGFTIAAGGIGGTLGSLLSAGIVQRIGLGRTFIATALINGLAGFLIPLAHGSMLEACAYLVAAQLIGDCSAVIYMINETSLRQLLAPPEVLGRVNAAMQLASRGVLPLGAVAGGFIADAVGLRSTTVIAAAGVFASVAWLAGIHWFSTGLSTKHASL